MISATIKIPIFVFIFEIFFVESTLSSKKVARIAVLLPADDRHMFSIKRVSPALEHAINETKRKHILPTMILAVRYGDTKCSNADGMNEAVSFYAKGQVDVFFGPCCDYAAAPVARQVAYWNIPLLTAGAMAKDFGKKMNREFSVLTRVGANFNSLGYYMIRVFNRYKWKRIKLVYNPNGQESVMHRFCHIAADGVHYALRTRHDLGNFTQAVHKFHKVDEVLMNLPEAIGLDFGGSIQRLQKVQDRAARLITRTKPKNHITPVLKQLLRLPVEEGIKFKRPILTYSALNVPDTPSSASTQLHGDFDRKTKTNLSFHCIRTNQASNAFSVSAPTH